MGGDFLQLVGHRVRARREAMGWTQKDSAARARLSVRFLAQLEHGEGNISLRRFADLAAALAVAPAVLLEDVKPRTHVALLGLRGAGKSTIGRRLARRLGVPFVELDDLVAQAAGMSLGELFELHGEAYYRRLEREALGRFLAEASPSVLATGGSIVNDAETFRLLSLHAVTVWLRARPEDHWSRVVAQGDRRPMGTSPHAFAEMKALLATREPLYASADHTVDTAVGIEGAVAAVAEAVGR